MQRPSSHPEHIIKQLFDNHFHHLVLAAMRYVNDYEIAEDIVQDVFVKVWQNFDDLQRVNDFKGYLFKAVKNSSLNYLRFIKVRQNTSLHADEIQTTFEKSVEESKIEEEMNNRIHAAVGKLPDHWRKAFVMSKYDHLKYHEIAVELNISQKTVEKYMSKSLQFLRKELKYLLLLGLMFCNFFR